MNWTKEQYEEYMRNYNAKKKKKDTEVQLKYKNNKVEVDGHVFDSKRESEIYLQFKILKQRGIITKMELQPRFLLQPSFRYEGKTIRAIYYQADFRITYSDGKEEVVDVKSYITEKNPVYRLKRKMFLYKYPDLAFREIF